jgi:serine/threonine protein kinase
VKDFRHDAAMSVPDLIGRYRLGQRLGSGGFAVVWLAHDESLDTNIAIKVMADNWSDRLDLRERFLMEARMLRRAASNRIVQVFDIGELPDGRPYFVMEYADRGTLADRVRTDPLPLVPALRVTAEVARGAAELHQAGIVHRDLKPSNVLIQSTDRGPERLLIADLGVAKNLAQASGVTMSVGSAGYMAPEQSGPNSGVDVRADVYSLGAIGYRLITGAVPGLPGFVKWDHPSLPQSVRRLLQRALEVDRERRWPDASSFAAELDRLAGEFSAPPPPSVSSRRRRPGRWALASVPVLAAVAALGYVVVDQVDQRKPLSIQDATKQITLDVPSTWNRVQPGGWDPGVLNLKGKQAPGLVASDTADPWSALEKDVNGVFVGVSDDPDLPAEVAKIKHPECRSGPSGTYTGPGGQGDKRWSGPIRTWDRCVGGSRTIREISLAAPDSSDWVYVQIRQDDGYGDDDAIRNLLDSLEVRRPVAAGK